MAEDCGDRKCEETPTQARQDPMQPKYGPKKPTGTTHESSTYQVGDNETCDGRLCPAGICRGSDDNEPKNQARADDRSGDGPCDTAFTLEAILVTSCYSFADCPDTPSKWQCICEHSVSPGQLPWALLPKASQLQRQTANPQLERAIIAVGSSSNAASGSLQAQNLCVQVYPQTNKGSDEETGGEKPQPEDRVRRVRRCDRLNQYHQRACADASDQPVEEPPPVFAPFFAPLEGGDHDSASYTATQGPNQRPDCAEICGSDRSLHQNHQEANDRTSNSTLDYSFALQRTPTRRSNPATCGARDRNERSRSVSAADGNCTDSVAEDCSLGAMNQGQREFG